MTALKNLRKIISNGVFNSRQLVTGLALYQSVMCQRRALEQQRNVSEAQRTVR